MTLFFEGTCWNLAVVEWKEHVLWSQRGVVPLSSASALCSPEQSIQLFGVIFPICDMREIEPLDRTIRFT